MLKSLLNLKGSKTLNAKEKKSINGGRASHCGGVPNCWVACPDIAPIVCGLPTGLYTGTCDCSCC